MVIRQEALAVADQLELELVLGEEAVKVQIGVVDNMVVLEVHQQIIILLAYLLVLLAAQHNLRLLTVSAAAAAAGVTKQVPLEVLGLQITEQEELVTQAVAVALMVQAVMVK